MVNAFSFCLFGDNLVRYHRGFIENVDMIKRHFPGWVIYVYLGVDVDPAFREYLCRDSVIRVRDTGVAGAMNTVHRFFAIDDPDVDVCFFRDADSRVHWKDRWAIREFVGCNRGAHVIRDHEQHTAMIMAGMWGLRKGALGTHMRQLFEAWTPVFAGNGDPNDILGMGIDQNFLVKVVYPRIRDNVFIHYSFDNLVHPWERGAPFPFKWTNSVYCGRPELGDGGFVDSAPPPTPFRLPTVFVKLS
jgi:hypothetical protein